VTARALVTPPVPVPPVPPVPVPLVVPVEAALPVPPEREPREKATQEQGLAAASSPSSAVVSTS